jgi:aspartate/methionine/tyrosine aminotransferase
MFSSRLPRSLQQNRLSRALAARRASGARLLDLTLTNPTTAGFRYREQLLAPLASREALRYEPQPLGLPAARAAVAADYLRRGISVAADRIVLTASTSDAYSVLFKLLCDPSGSAVLTPAPSYPLFDHLTGLDGVANVPYGLEYHGRWRVDFASVDAAWTPNVRALLAVSPNNPTGSILSGDEAAHLDARCADADAAVILDEVFADYPLNALAATPPAGGSSALTFRLGGLSKSAGLPQVKLGWIAVDGPDRLVDAALERLELVCDTYLPVSTPVQIASAALIVAGAEIRAQILDRVRANYAALAEAARAYPAVEVLHADGGWSAALRVPARASEEEIVLALLDHDSVVVHPGFFFDFPHEAFLVVSLLPEPAIFAEGVRRVLERVHD